LKKNEKYEVARQKCTRARNEYILCIDAANASLYKYFADDVSDLVDVSLGFKTHVKD
jgi:SLIT-ROBO Rho GTPase activating protein